MNHDWHDYMEPLRTTLSYLTLPRTTARIRTYGISEMEADCGYASIEGAQSSFIMLPNTATKERRVKQFNRALRVLQLTPYIHPGQLDETISADNVDDKKKLLNPHEKLEDVRKQDGKQDGKGEYPMPTDHLAYR